MIKIVFILSLMWIAIQAKMIGGVAMVVNNKPITLNEIKSFQQKNRVSKEDAVNALIQKKIEEEEIIKKGFHVSSQELNNQIAKIAQRNNMSVEEFQLALQKDGKDYDKFRLDIEDKIKKEKLYRSIIGNRLKKADESVVRDYYEKNKNKFKMPGSVEVLEYLSNSGEVLSAIASQPMVQFPNVKVTPKTIPLNKINPQVAMLLVKTADSSFTQVINAGNGTFAMFFVKSKRKGSIVPYEKVRDRIFAEVMKDREQALLIEYFEKKKSEASIKVIRKPS